jgi:hypothetical protein
VELQAVLRSMKKQQQDRRDDPIRRAAIPTIDAEVGEGGFIKSSVGPQLSHGQKVDATRVGWSMLGALEQAVDSIWSCCLQEK